ncbi:uncharacterized protein LOC132932958 [Metopolophium dirhodum]|uniref:uncharacterized protein LOC132932958 n=1 Tax=Metopolophium dirhodum TaxID=44670 RepID=UPI00298F8425|nr:uncharacterized protein LOC132932958 [Metopolophium dirhodum]
MCRSKENSPDIVEQSNINYDEENSEQYTVLSQNLTNTNPTSISSDNNMMDKMQCVCHTVMKVFNQMVSLQKDVNVIKIDVMKNQNLIAEVIDRQNHQTTQNQTVENITRSNLKIPLQTMEQLDSLEADDELKQILANVIRRNGKSFDSKRTTYQIMKIVLENRMAEGLNMEGRGEKRALGKMEIYAVKFMFPEESLKLIKIHMSDWLKQAPKRKSQQ